MDEREQREDAIERLREIQEQISELAHEARELFRDTNEFSRFKGYPYAHIVGALSNDHEFLGGSFITMEECINGLEDSE